MKVTTDCADAMQDKPSGDDHKGLSPMAQAKQFGATDTSDCASRLAQPSKSMAISDAVAVAEAAAEVDSLAAASTAAASASDRTAVMPSTPDVISHDKRGSRVQLGSGMLSISSDSLSALPTPIHPSAVPAGAAQELNSALGRSMLQGSLASDQAVAASPHSERLTSAYSGRLPP